MQSVLIIHEVEDYAAWKEIFDAAADLRKEAGERTYQVLKYASDPNKVGRCSAWTAIADAQKFFESPQLVRIRAAAGVKSPSFIYVRSTRGGYVVKSRPD